MLFELILEYLEQAGVAISLFAVAVIIFSFVFPTWQYARSYQKMDREQNFSRFKKELGSGLLLGLEILVVADVIETITTKPTFRSLAALAFLVAIRTVFSWTLFLEVEGRWPWQAVKGD